MKEKIIKLFHLNRNTNTDFKFVYKFGKIDGLTNLYDELKKHFIYKLYFYDNKYSFTINIKENKFKKEKYFIPLTLTITINILDSTLTIDYLSLNATTNGSRRIKNLILEINNDIINIIKDRPAESSLEFTLLYQKKSLLTFFFRKTIFKYNDINKGMKDWLFYNQLYYII